MTMILLISIRRYICSYHLAPSSPPPKQPSPLPPCQVYTIGQPVKSYHQTCFVDAPSHPVAMASDMLALLWRGRIIELRKLYVLQRVICFDVGVVGMARERPDHICDHWVPRFSHFDDFLPPSFSIYWDGFSSIESSATDVLASTTILGIEFTVRFLVAWFLAIFSAV